MRAYLSLVLMCCLVVLVGCQRTPKTTAEVPRHMNQRYSLAVMPFTQPTAICDLIMGQLPEGQGCIPADQLAMLDEDLHTLLLAKKGERKLSFEKTVPGSFRASTSYHAASQPQGIESWAKIAKQTGKDFILVPQVLNWHDREGSQAGVTESAHVRLEFFLIRAETGTVYDYAVFEEQQVGLTDNLLTLGEFVKRKGTWVSARELANEGMALILRDLGLN